MAKTRHRWREPFFDLLLPGGGDGGQRPAMKRVQGGQNLETPLIVPELAGQFEQALVGLDATIAKEAFARANQADQRLRQPALRFVVVEVRAVDNFARLLGQRLRDGRMRMAQRVDGDAAAQIEIAPAGDVVEAASRSVA